MSKTVIHIIPIGFFPTLWIAFCPCDKGLGGQCPNYPQRFSTTPVDEKAGFLDIQKAHMDTAFPPYYIIYFDFCKCKPRGKRRPEMFDIEQSVSAQIFVFRVQFTAQWTIEFTFANSLLYG